MFRAQGGGRDLTREIDCDCMARPKKIGLDYFPVDVVFDEKIQSLETIFGNDGLVWILKFWQTAYRNENGQVDLSKYFAEVLSKNCRITPEKQIEIVKFCMEIKLISEIETNIYSSNGIKKRISSVSKERADALKRYHERKPKKIRVKIKESKVKDFGDTSGYTSEKYFLEEKSNYESLIKDSPWVEEQKIFHPGLNVLLSLEKAHIQFWGTDAGWEHTKRKRSKAKDWKRTYQNALSQKVNQVWIPREKQEDNIEKFYEAR